MAKFDFRRQLKNLSLSSLQNLKEYHTELMYTFVTLNCKDAEKHRRYVEYIEKQISKTKN